VTTLLLMNSASAPSNAIGCKGFGGAPDTPHGPLPYREGAGTDFVKQSDTRRGRRVYMQACPAYDETA